MTPDGTPFASPPCVLKVVYGSIAVIASVTGTETNPQGFSRQVNTRRAAGLLAAAVRLAAQAVVAPPAFSLPHPRRSR